MWPAGSLRQATGKNYLSLLRNSSVVPGGASFISNYPVERLIQGAPQRLVGVDNLLQDMDRRFSHGCDAPCGGFVERTATPTLCALNDIAHAIEAEYVFYNHRQGSLTT